MSEFSLPPLAVDYDGRWVNVPLRGELGAWARQAAADYVRRNGGEQRQVAALLEGAGELVRRADDSSMALVLMPVPAEGIRALVRFCPVDMSGLRADDDGWSTLISGLIPDEPWEEPAEITEIATTAGPCRRLIRRYVTGEGHTRGVGEQVAYMWLFPRYGAAVVMTTSFINLAEAGQWRPALDELAAAVELEQAS